MRLLYEWLDDWDAAISDGVKKHQDSNVHMLAYWEVMKHLEKVHTAVDDEDVEKAVLWTAQFVHKVHTFENLIEKPKLKAEAARNERSAGGKRAAKARWNLPGWKEEAIQKEYKAIKKELGSDAPKVRIYEKLSERCFNGDKSKYKRFERMANKGLFDK